MANALYSTIKVSDRHDNAVISMFKSETVVVRGFVIPILIGFFDFEWKHCIPIDDSYFLPITLSSLNTLIATFMLSTTTHMRSITKWLSLHLN